MECKICVMEQFFVALQAPVSAPKDRKPDACGTEEKDGGAIAFGPSKPFPKFMHN